MFGRAGLQTYYAREMINNIGFVIFDTDKENTRVAGVSRIYSLVDFPCLRVFTSPSEIATIAAKARRSIAPTYSRLGASPTRTQALPVSYPQRWLNAKQH